MDEKPRSWRDDVLTIEELSAYLKIPKSTLYKLVREGKVPCQKIGRHWRFRKVAIDRWLEDLPAAPAAQARPRSCATRSVSTSPASRTWAETRPTTSFPRWKRSCARSTRR